MKPTALVLPAALAGAALLVPAASAQAPATRSLTLREVAKGSTFAYVDNAPKSKKRGDPEASLGDAIVFTNRIADASGARVGRLVAHCTVVVAAPRAQRATFQCTASMTLRDGTLAVVALTNPSKPDTMGAVVGGTGAYAGARGTLVSKAKRNGDSDDTITLLG
jgi:hypothetical protein